MHTYRLVIGSDGSIKIPGGEPGRLVTVLMEEAPRMYTSSQVNPIVEMSETERARHKQEMLDEGQRIRTRLIEQEHIDHDAELYGADGLPG